MSSRSQIERAERGGMIEKHSTNQYTVKAMIEGQRWLSSNREVILQKRGINLAPPDKVLRITERVRRHCQCYCQGDMEIPIGELIAQMTYLRRKGIPLVPLKNRETPIISIPPDQL